MHLFTTFSVFNRILKTIHNGKILKFALTTMFFRYNCKRLRQIAMYIAYKSKRSQYF